MTTARGCPGKGKAAALLAVSALACSGADAPPKGPPTLEGLDVVDPMGMPVSLDVDGRVAVVSPRVHFVARFDRLLDPAPLEEIVDGKPVGKPGVVLIEAPGQPQAPVTYVPNGDARRHLLFPPGPQLQAFPTPTLPSGALVKVSLDKTRIRARDGSSPYVLGSGAGDVVTFATLPFTASIQGPGGPPPPTEADAGAGDGDGGAGDAGVVPPAAPLGPAGSITVAFTNLPETAIVERIAVTMTDAGGAALPAKAAVKPSEMDPATVMVAPPEGGWPVGATVLVRVDASARDAVGVSIAAAAAQAFVVQP